MQLEFYPLIALLAIIGFYISGSIIAKISDSIFSSDFSRSTLFIKLFLGVYMTIPIYAIFKNLGNTSLLGVFVGMMVFLFLSKKKNHSYKHVSLDKKYYLGAIILILFSVLWECIFFIKVNGNYRLPHYDLSFYGYISQYIGMNNSENVSGYINLLPNISVNSFALYHYFEFWTTNLFVQFGLNAASAHLLITLPIFYSLILLGLIDLLSIKNPVFIILIFFATSGILLINTHSELILPILDLNANIIRSPFSSFTRKIAPVIPLVILSFIYLKERKYTFAIVISGLIPCINVIYIPFVFGGWGIFMLIKRFPIKALVYNGFLLVIPFGILSSLFLYHLFFHHSFSDKNTFLIDQESTFSVMTGIKYILGHLRLVIIYLPIILLLIIYRKKAFHNSSDLIIYSVAGFIASVGLGFILTGKHNAAQLSTVAGLSIISILIAYLLSNLYRGSEKTPLAIPLFLIAIGSISLFNNFIINFNQNSVNNNYSKSFIKTFIAKTNQKSSLGFYLKKDIDYEGYYGKQINIDFKGFPILYAKDTFYTISLDPIFKDKSEIKPYEFGYLLTSPLHKKKLYFPEKTDSTLIEEVLLEYNITWGLVSKDKPLPNWIVQRKHQVIIDSNTGDQLIILE